MALNWELAETLLALGIVPAGVPQMREYARWVSPPELPPGVTDVGLIAEPNFEALQDIKPDFILISGYQDYLRPQLERIAPTLTYSIYGPDAGNLDSAREVAVKIGQRFDRSAAAARLITDTENALSALRAAICPDQAPVAIVRFIDPRHMHVYGSRSLPGGVLSRLGLVNAWTSATNPWGFQLVGIEELFKLETHTIFVLGDMPRLHGTPLLDTPVWKTFTARRAIRFVPLGAVWSFGGLLAANRLADAVAKTFLRSEDCAG